MRRKTTYNKLIGKKDGAYYFLDDIFHYDDNFQGATATVLEPITKQEYEDAKSIDSLKDRGYDDLWKQAVQCDDTKLGLDEWLQEILDDDGDEGIWDLSGSNLWDQLREIGLTEEEYPVFECTGGGRLFSKDMVWDELYNEELWKKIQEVEPY